MGRIKPNEIKQAQRFDSERAGNLIQRADELIREAEDALAYWRQQQQIRAEIDAAFDRALGETRR